MTPLEQALTDYLSIRRSLGFRLHEVETHLRNFVRFLQAEGTSYITRELTLRWATQPKDVQSSTWASRLGMVRRFAIWYSATEPRTEIPPAGLLPHRYRRKPPYIYTKEEIEQLLRQTQQLLSPKGLRAHSYTTLFGLLVATGMRLNEAINSRSTRCRPSPRNPLHPAGEVWEITLRPGSCHYYRCSEKIRRGQGSRFSYSHYSSVLYFRARSSNRGEDGGRNLCQSLRADRPPRTHPAARSLSPAAGHAPPICCLHLGPLVSQGDRC